jgi:exodeoxyribonuclease V alpha subunit
MQELHGTIDRFVYSNQENGYAVCILLIDNKEQITINGSIAHLRPGELITVRGSWHTHAKFGRQFIVQSLVIHPLTSHEGLKKYLASGVIKGIGASYAQKLVDFFGTQVLEIIDKKPEELRRVPGVGPKRIESIIEGWQHQKEISHIMVFLQERGISPTYAMKIYKTYGKNARDIVADNPYRLAADVWGIGFTLADTIAQNSGIQLHDSKRIAAGICHVLGESTKNGHLYEELEDLKKKSLELLSLTQEYMDLLRAPLRLLHDEHKIAVLHHNGKYFIALASCYHTEKKLARRIKECMDFPLVRPLVVDDITVLLEKQAASSPLVMHDNQKKAIISALTNTITVITGGPGTGKTTVIKTILSLFNAYKLNYKLAAPTGRAAKRMAESTGSYATTIHRLLEFDVSTMAFTRNDTNALSCDILIIDETSMLDVFLAHAILKAVPLGSRILLIGDSDQLPSVGPGNFLHDLITSNMVPCVQLTHIFRQAHNSMIVVNAHRINCGKFPLTKQQEGMREDFLYITEEVAEQCCYHIETIFHKTLPRLGIQAHDAMVLTPMHRGVTGAYELNNFLQQLLNAQSERGIQYRNIHFKINDRVMQLKNNYDKLVFNGDLGYITAISTDTVSVLFDGRLVHYEMNECDEITLAYAISIHKSQGSEFDVVIIPLFMSHFMLLQKNLLYTAVTRAKKFCILIGQSKAITIALQNKKAGERITFLRHFLHNPDALTIL